MKDQFHKVKSLVPGLWDANGDPVDPEAAFIPSFDYPDCTVIINGVAGRRSNGEVIGKFGKSDIKSFTVHPGFGHTFNVTFTFFSRDIEEDGSDVGYLSVHTKKEVFVRVDRPNDLFDRGDDDDEDDDPDSTDGDNSEVH